MDDGNQASRSMVPGEKRRDDSHRPLPTPQEVTAALHQTSSASSNVDVFNDSRGQSQFSNDAKSSQMMQGRSVQHQNDAQMQKELALANKAIASQEMANHQQLQMAIQSQLAYHQLSNQAYYAIQQQQQHQQHIANQQMLNQQLRSAYADPQLLQQHFHGTQASQGVPVGMHSGNISLMQQLTAQKPHDYEELKKKEYQLEQRKLHEAQSSAQEYQRQKLQSSQMSDLDFHQKLAALQMSHPEAAYLQQSSQQQQMELQKQQHQQQMQYHQQMQHYQQMQHQQMQHHQRMQQQLHQSQLNAMSTQLGHGTERQVSTNPSDLFETYNGQHRSQHE